MKNLFKDQIRQSLTISKQGTVIDALGKVYGTIKARDKDVYATRGGVTTRAFDIDHALDMIADHAWLSQ